MAAHARLKNEFTEDKKYHNLIAYAMGNFYLQYHLHLPVFSDKALSLK